VSEERKLESDLLDQLINYQSHTEVFVVNKSVCPSISQSAYSHTGPHPCHSLPWYFISECMSGLFVILSFEASQSVRQILTSAATLYIEELVIYTALQMTI